MLKNKKEMKWIKYLDIYGTAFEFSVFNEPKFKTFIGGLLSIATLVLIVIFAFLFGTDFFFRKNPQTLVSKQNPNEFTYFNLSQETLLVPFRINYNNGSEADINGIIFPLAIYQKYEKNPETQEFLYTPINLEINRCHEDPNFPSFNLENYYCINFTDVVIGGDWDAEKMLYVSIILSFCPDGGLYNKTECSRFQELEERLKSDDPYVLAFLYPEHYFQPQNREPTEALKTTYKGYTLVLNLELVKEDYFYFQKAKLVDDEGLITASYRNTSQISLFSQKSDYYSYSSDATNKPVEGGSSLFYFLNIYMTKDFDEYSRIYMKFQDVVANIGGFIKVIMIFAEIVCSWSNSTFLEAHLLSYLFSFREGEIEKKRIKKKLSYENKFYTNTDLYNNITNNNINNLGSGGNIGCSNSIILNNSLFNRSSLPINLGKNNTQGENSTQKRKELIQLIKQKRNEKGKKKKLKFSYFHIFQYNLFPCCIKDASSKIEYNRYKFGLKALKTRKDIINYFDLLNELQMFKNFILKESDCIGLHYVKKPNINNRKEISSLYGNEVLTEEEEYQKLKKFLMSFRDNNQNKISNILLNNNFMGNSNKLLNETVEKSLYEKLDSKVKQLM